MLLTGDQMLQTASAKCIAAVLVHSGTQGSTPLIKADIPGDYAHTETQTPYCFSLIKVFHFVLICFSLFFLNSSLL